jgi:hypothetical protein
MEFREEISSDSSGVLPIHRPFSGFDMVADGKLVGKFSPDVDNLASPSTFVEYEAEEHNSSQERCGSEEYDSADDTTSLSHLSEGFSPVHFASLYPKDTSPQEREVDVAKRWEKKLREQGEIYEIQSNASRNSSVLFEEGVSKNPTVMSTTDFIYDTGDIISKQILDEWVNNEISTIARLCRIAEYQGPTEEEIAEEIKEKFTLASSSYSK